MGIVSRLGAFLIRAGLSGREHCTDHSTREVKATCEGEFWGDINPSRHWLFLDIDGVLHRAENGSLEYMGVLESVLNKRPDVGIILSTNWRIGATRESVLRHFPHSVRERIAGANPDLDGKVADHVRFHECMYVVNVFGLTRYTFVDDTARLFPDNCRALFLTLRHEGLNESAVAALMDRML